MPTTSPPANAVAQLRNHRARLYAQGFLLTEAGKQVPVYPTGMTQPRGEQLRNLLAPERPARTIETGFAYGISSLYILEASLTSSVPENVHHTAVDPFQRSNWGNAGLRSLRDAGLADHFRLLEADSALVLPALVSAEETFDAAFVDGSHLFDGAFIDIHYMSRLVRPGGLIILDDYWMPAVRTAIDFFATNLNMPLQLHADEQGRPKLASLRVPTKPLQRDWDHFVAFSK